MLMGFWQTFAIVLCTAVFTWIGHAVVSVLQRRTEKDKALEAEKRVAYKQLLQVLFGVLKTVKQGGTEAVEQEIGDKFFELARDMTVYASDEVLRLFIRFKNQQQPENPIQVLKLFGELIIAIRKDLGHDQTTVSVKEVLSSFITDVDNLDI
jgi:flagellar motor component MotA